MGEGNLGYRYNQVIQLKGPGGEGGGKPARFRARRGSISSPIGKGV